MRNFVFPVAPKLFGWESLPPLSIPPSIFSERPLLFPDSFRCLLNHHDPITRAHQRIRYFPRLDVFQLKLGYDQKPAAVVAS